MTDVQIYQTVDGGEIDYVNGQAVMTPDGIAAAGYLSLFGGNEDDSGDEVDNRRQWWANLSETDPDRIYRSETQNLVRTLPLIPANLKRIEDAAARDLAWFETSGLATGLGVRASIVAPNRVKISGVVEIDGLIVPFEFTEAAQ
jgi:phage gp46-like protein